jgi:glycine dehydrogenase
MTALRKNATDVAKDFARRHIGPSPRDIEAMLESVSAKSLAQLMDETLPASIRQKAPLNLGPALSETDALAHMTKLAEQNLQFTSLIGQGYSGSATSWKTRPGTRPTRPISLRSARDGWRHCSTSRPWSAT